MSDEFEEVTILRKDKPDLVFEGKLIAEVDSKAEAEANGRKSNDRWTELALYELRNGDWLAVSVACSDKAGESDFGEVKRILQVDESLLEMGDEGLTPIKVSEEQRRRQAMAFWNWTWLAKKLATEQGWEVRERLT
jgi:hypothetical protein